MPCSMAARGKRQLDENELARACAQVMWDNDRTSHGLGMEIEEIRRGYARLSMTITDAMTNGQNHAHGGFIFTLADSTFAFACNSYNQYAVAQHCSITYIAPGMEGDRLTAEAVERSRSGRSGLYDVTVRNQDSLVIAEFRGASRTVRGQHLPDEGQPAF